jgi:hypothetical protein
LFVGGRGFFFVDIALIARNIRVPPFLRIIVTRRTFLLDFSCLKKGVGSLFSKLPPTFFIYPAPFECYVNGKDGAEDEKKEFINNMKRRA